MLSYLVDENYAILLFFMLIATCVQHGIFTTPKDCPLMLQMLAMFLGEMEIVLKG
jgi:hypothetical protein